MNFYERTKNACENRGTNLTDLMKKLGLSTSMPTNWKKRGTLPSAEVLIKLSDELCVSIDYLLKGEDFMSIQEQTNDENNLFAKEFYDRLVLLCNFKGINIDNLHEDVNLHILRSDVESWKNGIAPNFTALKEISDKFNVSIKYLIFGSILDRNSNFCELKTLMKKLNVSWEHLSSFSGVDLNVLDYLDQIEPIGTLHFSIQNSIQNLLRNANGVNLDFSLKDCKYSLITKNDAEEFLSFYNLPSQAKHQVLMYIDKINDKSIDPNEEVFPVFAGKHPAILTDEEYGDLINKRKQRETKSTSGTA